MVNALDYAVLKSPKWHFIASEWLTVKVHADDLCNELTQHLVAISPLRLKRYLRIETKHYFNLGGGFTMQCATALQMPELLTRS
jgi:hypothetical protein